MVEPKKRSGFHDRTIKGLSISMIVIGSLCFLLGLGTLVIGLMSRCVFRDLSEDYYHYGYDQGQTTTIKTFTALCAYSSTYVNSGIWSGLMFIASGIVGVMAAKRKTTCFIVSAMVTSLVSVWIAAASMLFSIAANFDNHYMAMVTMSDVIQPYPLPLTILNALVATFSFACLVLSSVKFGFACRAVCCIESLPFIKRSGYQYQPLQTQPLPFAPVAQPALRPDTSSVHQPNAAQPIYLVQGQRVIGMLPGSIQRPPAQAVVVTEDWSAGPRDPSHVAIDKSEIQTTNAMQAQMA